MISLSAHENKVYLRLIDEYNQTGLFKICSLESYLISKYENEKNNDKAAIYYQIWWFVSQ